VLAQIEPRLAPIEQDRQTRAASEQQQAVTTRAQEILAEVKQQPLFKEHAAEILAAMEADGRLSLHGAYTRVVVPKLGAAQKAQTDADKAAMRQEIMAEVAAKAAAGTVNPGASSAPSMGKTRQGSTLSAFEAGFRRKFGGT